MTEIDSTKNRFLVINIVASIATALILYRSHIPGGSDFNGLGIIIWMLIGPAWVWAIVLHRRNDSKNPHAVPSRLVKRRILIVPIMAGLSVLPVTQLPQFICFTLFRPYLEEIARTAGREYSITPRAQAGDKPKGYAGPFPVYDVVVEETHGRVWIVTTIREDGFSPALLVDGFVLNPSVERQSPFGRKYYEKVGPLHMKDGWYTFQASNELN